MRSAIVTAGPVLLALWLTLCLAPSRVSAAPVPASMASTFVSQLTHSPATTLALWLAGGAPRFLQLVPAGAGTGLAPMIMPQGLAALTVEPVAGIESSGYGYRRDPMNRRRRKFHKGVDYRAPRGTPVHAAGPGVVRVAERKNGYGRVIFIAHGNGIETRYAHLNSIEVRRGQLVTAGTRIGTVGSTGRATGPHLHFEVRQDGEALDPRWAMGLTVSEDLEPLW